ncbi:MAG: amidohydrolase family protein [Acidobacteriota bacterium]
MQILAAKYLIPVASDPMTNGAIVIDDSRIIDIGTRQKITSTYPDVSVDDHGEAAILPGFVNCHSHLEVTALRGALDTVENNFSEWLLKLTAMRASMSPEDVEVSAMAGVAEGLRAGITCFGDIGRFGRAGSEAMRKAGVRGVLFQETEFSADARSADVDLEKLLEKYYLLKQDASGLVEIGISPHSPYTVSGRLLEKLGRIAVDEFVKLSIHTAESRDEEELLQKGTGFFRSIYEKYSVEWTSPLMSSVEYLYKTGVLRSRPQLVHCVTVSDDDLGMIAESGSTVAHCPKSNAKLGHGSAPFEKMLDHGISVGFGSDSVVSNNNCDLIEEARFGALTARGRSGSARFLSAAEIIETVTLGGAKTLGLDDRIGSLEKGKQADLAVVSLTGISQQPISDVLSAILFSSSGRDVIATYIAGKAVFSNGELSTLDENELISRLQKIAESL